MATTETAGRDVRSPGADRSRRAELGDFLKARRAALRPEDVGLPPGPRRRTPGLRREEVALLAGVGVSWYTWLEQGRPINASWQVLDAVARTLRLDGAGRWHLYRLAEAMPVRSWATTTVVPDAVSDVIRSLDPLPAVLINSRFDIIQTNDAHEEMFWDWHSLPCVHKNLLWCAITEPRAREMFLNYDEEIPYLVARLRAAYAQHIGDPEWDEDIRRLAVLSPEFAELWARHEVAAPAPRTLRFRHAEAGPMTFTRTELDVLSVSDLRVAAYSPQDDDTRERLPRTRRARAADPL
ncbi:MAG TPA: helix-turn-helix transcriptional regulator [Streptosporangiaceae bacterium]|nr:helix-turn-helix transcriptional regulator [Streptosporangiaceae bacterium]